MSAQLFEVTYIPSPGHAPLVVLAMSADIADEKVLWIAGGDPNDPEVTLALADAIRAKYVGTVHTFLQENIEHASQIQEARASNAAKDSSKVCALEVLRAISYMRFDATLSAPKALEFARAQTTEIVEMDREFAQQVLATET
jgi:hypothetical protein